MSSTATIRDRDNGSSTAAGAIMPCVGGLIFWVDFPSNQRKGANDWPSAIRGHTDARTDQRQPDRHLDADECNFKET